MKCSIPTVGVSQDLGKGCPNLLEISKQGVQIVHLKYFYIIIIIMIIQKICSAHICTLLDSQGTESRNTGASFLLFHDECPGFFYMHYTTHGTYSFMSYPKDEAVMVKCLDQGHKRRNRPGRDSNPHSDNTRTWVQCARPLGHDM